MAGGSDSMAEKARAVTGATMGCDSGCVSSSCTSVSASGYTSAALG